jgi:hypothetical protein
MITLRDWMSCHSDYMKHRILRTEHGYTTPGFQKGMIANSAPYNRQFWPPRLQVYILWVEFLLRVLFIATLRHSIKSLANKIYRH